MSTRKGASSLPRSCFYYGVRRTVRLHGGEWLVFHVTLELGLAVGGVHESHLRPRCQCLVLILAQNLLRILAPVPLGCQR